MRSAAPGYEPPPGINRDEVAQAYDYLKFRNKGKDWQDWQALDPNDEGTPMLQAMKAPAPDYMLPSERDEYARETQRQDQIDAIKYAGSDQKPVDYKNLEPWQQLYLGLFSPQSKVEGTPLLSRISGAAIQTAPLALGSAKLAASIHPLAGLAVGAGLEIGGTYWTTAATPRCSCT
jgi:hypothetical protein